MRDVVVMAEAVRAAISSFLAMMPIALDTPGARASDSTAQTGITRGEYHGRQAKGAGLSIKAPLFLPPLTRSLLELRRSSLPIRS